MSLLLEDVKMTFCEWLRLEDHNTIDVVLGAIVCNSLKGDPVNLYIVAPPSSGKTEILRALNDYPRVYYLSNLTSQTLVSGSKSRDIKVKNSLLLKLKDLEKTILVLKDFTTVLEIRNEPRQEILSQLREIADGYYRKTYGTGEEVTWTGKLAIIAGVTPIIERHHSTHQVLGERFLYYRISPNDPRAMAEMAQKFTGKEDQMRRELRETVKEFLEQFQNFRIEDVHIDDGINEKLFSLACFVAEARSGVSRDRYTQAIEYLPEAEGPARLVKQLFTLGCGIAIIQGKNELDENVFTILKKVGRDTLPSNRNLILRTMWRKRIFGNRWEQPRTLSGYFNYPSQTTKLHLEDLMVLNLVERKIEGVPLVPSEDADSYHRKQGTTAPYFWQLSERCCELIRSSEIYEDDS